MLVRHLCLLGSGGDLLPDLVDTAVRKEKEDIAVRKIVGRGCVREILDVLPRIQPRLPM